MGLRFGPCVGLAALLVLFLGLLTARAQVTVYTPPATPQSTGVRQGPPPKAANETAQPLPPLPQNLVGSITINVNQPNVSSSIPQKGNFLGVSLELSVADEICEHIALVVFLISGETARFGAGWCQRSDDRSARSARYMLWGGGRRTGDPGICFLGHLYMKAQARSKTGAKYTNTAAVLCDLRSIEHQSQSLVFGAFAKAVVKRFETLVLCRCVDILQCFEGGSQRAQPHHSVLSSNLSPLPSCAAS